MLAEDFLADLKPAPGDQSVRSNAEQFLDSPGGQARLTVYTRFDDGPEYYDGRTAKMNPLTGHPRAQEGVTIAVDPDVIPYGSKVRIPSLADFSANGDGVFIAHDTGGAVRSRKASGGKEPVIDVYVEGANPEQAGKRRDALANSLGTNPLEYEVIEEGKPVRKLTADEYLAGGPKAMTPEELDRSYGGKIKTGDRLPDRYTQDVDVPDWRSRSASRYLEEPDNTPGVLDHLANAIERGSLQWRLADEMGKEKPRASTVAALQGLLGDYPSSPDLNAFNSAQSTEEALKAFAKSPLEITSELVAESMASYLPTMATTLPKKVAKGIAIGAGTGAAAGSVVPGVGTAAGAASGAAYGARAGFIEASGAASYALETSGKILETLQDAGVDVTNDKALAEAFANPELMEKARTKAKRKGLPIAIFDAFSAAIGGKIFSTPAKSILGKLGHGAVELGVQAGLGMAGEAAGELNAGEKLQPAAILAEGIGELGPGTVEVVTGLASREGAHAAPVSEAAPTETAAAPSLADVSVAGEEPAAEVVAPTSAPAEAAPAEGNLPSLLADLEEEGQPAPTITPQAPEPVSASAPTPVIENPITAETVSDSDRARLVREYSFPRGLADYVTPTEVAALFAERPGTRKTEPVLQSTMRNAQARMDAAESEAEVVAPFSLKPSADVFLDSPTVEEARTLGRAATKGWAVQPQILWHQSVDDLPQDKVGRFARRAAQQNSFVEGYWLNGKVFLVVDDLAQVAAERGISFEQRVREIILHEAVGHGGIGAVLDGKGKRVLNSIVDGVLARMPTDEKTALAKSYGYDLTRADARSKLAEEWLARQVENGVPQQTWIARVIAQIRDLLRAALPGLQVTENDVAYLLSQGWKRTQTEGAPVRGQGFSYGGSKASGFEQARKEGRVFPGKYDGKPRFEIDDSQAMFRGEPSELHDGTLGEWLNHPELYKQYPQLRNLPISWIDGWESFGDERGILIGRKTKREQLKSVVLHETQHALQSIERFAMGGELGPRVSDYVRAAGEIESRDVSARRGLSAEQRGKVAPYSSENIPLEDAVVRFSVQPRSESEVPTPSTGQRRQFIDKVKASTAMAPQVKAQVESIYQPLSDKTAIAEAKARVTEIGIDAAEREVLAINSTNNPPTKRSNVLALELLGRLNASGEYDRAAAIAMHIAENNTSQAQAIQSMALFARLGPEGIQAYTAKVVQQAVKTGGFTDEVQKLYADLERLKADLAKERNKATTSAILDAQDLLKAAGFTAEKLADVQRKLRAALMQSLHEPGNAETRIVGLLIAAGMDRKRAEKLAAKVVKEAQRHAKQARDRALRGMLRLKQGLPATPKLESEIQERIRQTMISNPGSLWARYRAQAAKQLGNTAATLADPGLRVQTPALQDFSARLVRQLVAQLPKEARPRTEQDAMALLSEAVTNADKYRDVWNEARRYVVEKYKGNPQMLDKLDKLIGHQLDRPFSEATMQRAVDQALKSLETSVRDLLTRSQIDKNVAKAQLVSLIQDRTGVSGEQAVQLGNDILKAWDRSEGKAREAYAKGLFKDPIAKVSKGELQKWIEMNNAGLLNDGKFYAQIAAKYGLPVFTETEARRIAELQRRFDQAPDGDAKLVAGARMMDAVHSMVPAGFWSKVNSVRNMAMLLNPKTTIRNIGGNAVLFLTDVAADTINSWVIDPAVSLVTGKRTRSSAAIGSRLSGLAQPWRDFWAGVEQQTGSVTAPREKAKVAILGGTSAGIKAADRALKAPYSVTQATVERLLGKRLPSIPVELPYHHASERLFEAGLAYLRDLARVTQHGIWDSKDFTKSFRHTFSSRTMRLFEDSLAIVLGSADRAFHSAAYQSSITNQLAAAKANGQVHLAPTPAMVEQALLDANRAVLQDQNIVSSFAVKTKRALNVLGAGKPIDPKTGAVKMGEPGEFGLGSAVLPFGQVPGAVVMRGVEYSPLGFAKAMYETPLGKVFGRTGQFDQKAFGEAFSRALLGTAAYGLGSLLLRLGVISALPDDDKDREAMRRSAGLGGLRINVSELWRRLLTLNFHTPASMFDAAQDGDTIISYDWLQPVAFATAAGAQSAVEKNRMAEATQTGKIPATSSAFVAGLLGSSRSFEQMSVLAGLKRFAQSTGQRQSLMQALGEQALAVPASFIPTVVKDLNSVVDNTVRETRTDTARHPVDAMVNAVLERIPGTAQRFPPRYDAFGEAMQRYQLGGHVLFNALLNPAFTSEVRKTPVLRELERVYAATLNPGVTPSSPDRIVTINGKQRELTNEELAHFKYFTGRLATQRISQMIASPVWNKLPDSVKAKYAAEAFTAAAAAGKILLFGDRPKQPDRKVVQAAMKARQMGLTSRPWE